jgi:hypothetical protein
MLSCSLLAVAVGMCRGEILKAVCTASVQGYDVVYDEAAFVGPLEGVVDG